MFGGGVGRQDDVPNPGRTSKLMNVLTTHKFQNK